MKRKSFEIKIRGYHLDLLKHVNHLRYIEFLEQARWHFFEDLLESNELKKITFFIANINIKYLHPATMGDTLTIDCELKSIKKKSWTISQRIKMKKIGTPVAEANTTMVAIDARSGKSILINEKLRCLIESLFP